MTGDGGLKPSTHIMTTNFSPFGAKSLGLSGTPLGQFIYPCNVISLLHTIHDMKSLHLLPACVRVRSLPAHVRS
jgi:hypothetical protein